MNRRMTDRRGVVRKGPPPAVGSGETPPIAETPRNEYLAFALAHQKKPWARRWLRGRYMGRFL